MRIFWCTTLALIVLTVNQSFMSHSVTPNLKLDPAGPEPWTSSQLISPQGLAARISRGEGVNLTIVQVGFSFQYRSRHIKGAVFAGPAAKPEGLSLLKALVKDLPRGREVILYCGCCPWDDCPNIRPAFRLLMDLGFSKAQVLMLPASFVNDWVDKGFPVETGGSVN